jgi:hypothetical protein
MKEKVSPLMLIVAGVVVLAGLGLLIWKLTSGAPSGEAPGTIVKPANPNDPKYRPDPRLGLGGGGA